MNAAGPGDPGRGRRLAAYSVAAVATLASLMMLASVGVEAARGQRLDGVQILLKCVYSTLLLTVAFLSVSQLMRYENEQATRGRAVVAGAKAPGWGAAARVAVLSLLLTLALMAGLEVGARALAPGVGSDENSSGARALAEAMKRTQERGRDGETDSTEDSSGNRIGSTRTPGLVGTESDRAEPNAASIAGTTVGDLLSDEPVLRVTTLAPPTTPSLHLRGLVLDQYGNAGILRERRSPNVALQHAAADGWIHLDPGATPGRAQMELGVEFVQQSNGIVFAPSRLDAIQTESILFAPGTELWTLAGEDQHHYRTRSEPAAWTLEFLDKRRSAGSLPEGAFTALPAAAEGSARDHALRSLRAYAQSLTAGDPSDLESVLDVVSHLRMQFGYELYDTSFLSPERCLDLIERGAGSCSHFASLAAVLLRSRGIPVRIAVGYVAREPLADGDGWLVRSRDGHAWIEVHFEGAGWLPFDPTPGDQTAGGAEFGWAPVTDSEEAIAEWTNPASRSSRAHTSALGDWVVDGAERAALALGGSLKRLFGTGPGGIAGIGLALALALAGLVAMVRRLWPASEEATVTPRDRARPASAQQDSERGTRPPPLPEARALMEALDAREWHQGRMETPSAFARGVEQRHHEAEGLLLAFWALLRRTSTHQALTPAQTRELRGLAQRLRDGGDSSLVSRPEMTAD